MIDTIWAGLNGLGAATADDANPDHGQIVAVGLAWLAVSGISAIYGYTKVSECSDAKRLRDERYYPERVVAPAPGAAPPPGAVVPAASGVAPVRAVPAVAPMPAAAPAPAAPAAAPAPAPPATAPAPAASGTSPSPTSSLLPSRSLVPVHLAVRTLSSRLLAMRPALVAD